MKSLLAFAAILMLAPCVWAQAHIQQSASPSLSQSASPTVTSTLSGPELKSTTAPSLGAATQSNAPLEPSQGSVQSTAPKLTVERNKASKTKEDSPR